jgi:hypothetical protein
MGKAAFGDERGRPLQTATTLYRIDEECGNGRGHRARRFVCEKKGGSGSALVRRGRGCIRLLVQARRVLGEGAHFAFGHSAGDLCHHPAVDVLAVLVQAARAGLERLQLRESVVGILTR